MMNKVVLITGTSSGFGKLTAITLANAGYNVIATMRNSQTKNAAVAEELSGVPNLTVIDMDISDEASVNGAVEQIIQTFETIDVVVNNAAVWGSGVTEAYSVKQQQRMFDINYFGVVRVYNAVLPFMRKQQLGLFINLTTGASGFTTQYVVPYFASKMAIESLTEGLQEELRPFNIDNVTIQPGAFDTGISLKEGIQPDRPEVIAAYGDKAAIPMSKMIEGLIGSAKKIDPDPQLIADGILEVIQMKQGIRPLRFPIDPILEGIDLEFVELRAAIRKKWAAKYGF